MLDDFLATELHRAGVATESGGKFDVAATWPLCRILEEYGLAESVSTGVSARSIGPFQLVVVEDAPRDMQAVIQTAIPIAVSKLLLGSVLPVVAAIAGLSFTFRVIGACAAAGCLIEDPLEWQALLEIKAHNEDGRFPDESSVISAIAESSGCEQHLAKEALDSLRGKKPLWGTKHIAVVQQHADGGFESLA